MALVQKNINWKPYEVIYSAGEEPSGVYLIKEGVVELYTPEGLKLNEIGESEIFGESSIILGTKRTVTAKTGKQNVFASFIPKLNFLQLIEKNVALSALIKSPVKSISIACLFLTNLDKATIGVEQNNPILTPGVANLAEGPA
mgnify:CR=1 FL=1